MRYIEVFEKYVKALNEKGFKDAGSDVLLLIYEVFDFDFSKWTMFKYDEIKHREKLDILESYVSKRLENMPIQYILNKAYFCGFPFFVDKSVLIPRFDTEVLVEEILRIAKGDKNKKILVVSTLGINELIELSQGRKSIITEFLFNDGKVVLVEEGLEYKKYTKPAALINLYDEYVKKVQEFGIKVVKRTEVKNIFNIKEKVYLKGLITERRLRDSGLRNQMIVVDGKGKITSLAMDYIKENSIELCYERGK